MDWVKSLSGYTNAQIGGACDAYLKTGPNRRPTPRDIIGLIGSERSQDAKDRRAKLSIEQQGKLEGILDTARKWVSEYPEGHTLSQHGKQTLAYWGEAA